MTLVGVDVTSRKASDEVMPAGIASSTGSRSICRASAMRSGTMMIPVTVLLENMTFMSDTPITTAKMISTGCRSPSLLNATCAIQPAAPVL